MKIISYIRVSTQKQGESGLGLEAQEAAIRYYAGGQHQVLAQYQEVESGRNCDRPELAKALAHCRREKATLVVAKLDRLARNVAFLSSLMESTVPFVACDNPTANRLTIHILAAISEHEAEAISARTKAAMQAYKARGGKLGRPGGFGGEDCKRGGQAAGAIQHKKAVASYADIVSDVNKMRLSGKTFQWIANQLNAAGRLTRTSKQWSPKQVSRVLDLADVKNYPCLTV